MKKRILALLLCCTLLLGLLPAAFTAAADADASFKVVDASGAAVSYVEVPQNGKFALTAQKSQSVPAGAYQWQISVPGTDGVWANILDAQGSTLELSYAMVANMLQSGLAYVRCRLTAGEQTLYTDAVSVAIGYAAIEQPARMISEVKPVVISEAQPIGQPILTPAQSAPAAAPAAPAAPADPAPAADPAPTADPAPSADPAPADPAPADPAPADEAPTTDEAPTEALTEAPAADETPAEGGTTESPATNDSPSTGTNDAPSSDTYLIIINYVFENGDPAANSWTAKIAAGSGYQQTVKSPVVTGYKPNQESVVVDVQNASKDTTITVTYYPAEVNYTVKHWQQNVNNDEYTLEDTETKTGLTGSTLSDKLAKSYPGFYNLLYEITEIAADGSTEVNVYYDRYYYLMSFDLDGGYGVEPIYARYGAPINIVEPTKAGYSFDGWNPTLPTTMPEGNSSYKAQWNAGNAKYVVQYWQENANDDDYSYVEQVTKTASAGAVVSGSNDKSYAGFTFNAEKTDTNITVSGDGSTVVNVYYKRNIYEVRFYDKNGRTEDTSKRITAKYGAYIGDRWPGNGWYVDRYNNTSQSNLSTMPLGGKNFYGQQTGRYTSTATYYVEVLPGENGTEQVQGKSYKIHHIDTAQSSGRLNVTDEERYDIEGFTCNVGISASNGSNYNGAKFYYTRNNYDLVFDDQYGQQVSEKLPFEQILSESVNYKNNYQPTYPSTLEAGAYTFGGWYTDPGCTHPVDWSAKMPAAKVILYAKWTPKTHTVKTYLTEDAMNNGEAELDTWDAVPHGTAVTDPPADPEREPYKFVGWFYKDNGEEKAFDFTMPVNRDLNLYAKWRNDSLVEYTIHYQLEDETKIAEDTTGSALAGTTKTFDAKTGAQLNEGYQSGYFPKTSSHSLEINIEGGNEYTFVYVHKAEVNYTVRYLEKDTNKVLHEEKHAATRDTVITEKFVQINGYAPDAYQKRLVLSADEEKNVITFWYVPDEVHAPVQIIHWTQNIAGDGYTEYQSSTDLNGMIGQTYTEDPLTIPGFTYNEGVSKASGELTKAGLVLNLYYDRNEYPYEFRFLEQDTNEVLAEAVTGSARYQAQVTQTAKTIPGYKLVSGAKENQEITIAIEDPADVASKNVKTFYYVEDTVKIMYQVVGPTGSGALDSYQDNGVGVIKGTVNGSTPTAAKGFKFVGWFKDADCTQPVDSNWVGTGNKLTPDKTKNFGTEEAPVMGYEAATYYAKFENDVADLTITKSGWDSIDENQSFIFEVSGEGISTHVVIHGNGSVTIKGLKIGTYTVTEVTSWSWRYTPDSNPQNITLQPVVKNEVTFANTRTNGKWLSGDCVTDNRFYK